ncbi:MAG: hypothetical protein L0220_13065, partial [Acidobacteria bacterium]|nr:hypothetical protein [Acidobacteriota bacterium]
ASPIATEIDAVLTECGIFEGTKGGLLKALNGRLEARGENPKNKKGWPGSARSLGAKLKEIAPNLRRNGIEVDIPDTPGRDGYQVILNKSVKKESTEPSKVEKDVHNVHNVHTANNGSSLDREHVREHLKTAETGNVHSQTPAAECEHLVGEHSVNVHANVHTVSHCKNKAGERCEHCEHLFPPDDSHPAENTDGLRPMHEVLKDLNDPTHRRRVRL